MTKVKKIVLSGVFVAVAVVGSFLHVPLGGIRLSPVQHIVNLLAGVLLGPLYATLAAFSASTIRLISGLGSPLAFPGSMIGAFLCGVIYKKTKIINLAYLGEIFGTGILGALLAYPIAKIFLGQTIAIIVLVPSFALSTILGASISLVLLKVFKTN